MENDSILRDASEPKSVIDKFVGRHQILPTSRDWLVAATDPFHDFDLTPPGIPDRNTTDSVMRLVKKQVTLSAPSDIVGNWQCMMMTMPTDNTEPESILVPPTAVTYDNFGQEGTSFPYAGGIDTGILNFFSGSNATPGGVSPVSPTFDAATVITGIRTADPLRHEGLARLVAFGFEVENVTPQLTRGGSVTVGRLQSQIQDHIARRTNGGDVAPVIETVEVLRAYGMPANTSELFRTPDSRQWNAEDGVYITGTFDEQYTKFEELTNYNAHAVVVRTGFADTGQLAFGNNTFNNNVTPPLVPQQQLLTHLDSSIAWFTGLSPETVLVVTVKAYWETLPYNTASTLDFAQPSTPYDPNALEMYSRTIQRMPSGCKKGENARGDWFRAISGIFSTLAPFIPVVGPAIAGALPTINVLANAVAKKIDERGGVHAVKKDKMVVMSKKEAKTKNNAMLVLQAAQMAASLAKKPKSNLK